MCLSLMATFMDQLLGKNEGVSDGKGHDNGSDWKPLVPGLQTRSEHDDNDGQICWDGNEHFTDRFSYFEFHSTVGVMPPCKLINMLRR